MTYLALFGTDRVIGIGRLCCSIGGLKIISCLDIGQWTGASDSACSLDDTRTWGSDLCALIWLKLFVNRFLLVVIFRRYFQPFSCNLNGEFFNPHFERLWKRLHHTYGLSLTVFLKLSSSLQSVTAHPPACPGYDNNYRSRSCLSVEW